MAVEGKPKEERGGALVDFGPVLVFAIVYKVKDILWATGALIIATLVALVVSWVRERRVRVMPLITGVIVLVFGGLTIWFNNPRFIYVKPTIVSSLLGTILLVGLAFGRPLLKPVLDSALELTDAGWRALSLRFGIFSLGLAGLNEVAWRTLTPEKESYWVGFKFLGIPGLTVLFLLLQSSLIKRHSIQSDQEGGEPEKPS